MAGKIIIDVQAFKQALTAAAGRNAREFLFSLRGAMAKAFGGPKTGRVYPRPRPLTGSYRASAPGEPPAIASGRMFRSISQPRMVSPFEAEMTIDTPYAAILEGLEKSARVKPRPFVKPSIRAVKEQFGGARDRF